ncbi:TonB-dependent receptor [Phocaeicola vulgatus]|jgi:TonB-linked SusC/RagA family outer membrane protein|uniref:TonB-dependent receptor n=1 Tax=Phocaeicola vulgatus TaxID=821 RepID=UPI0032C00A41
MKNILYQESIVEIKHLFRMMRNTLLALFVFAGTAFATESYSQTMKVTVVADNVSTGKVISEIEKQTDYLFVYNVNEVNLKRNVKVNAQNKSVAEVLNKIFEGTDIYYAMEGKNIMLMSKAKEGGAVQQVNKVTGIVKDANGEPIIGANVMVKGQSIGTITDIDGRFVLDAPKDAILQISYIGYITQDISVKGKNELAIQLKEDAQAIEEVVVVGYGSVKKSNLTGALSSVKMDEVPQVATTSVSNLLIGRVPGLSIRQTSASPNGSYDMVIRGSASIEAGNTPLYVIDGFPGGDINAINPGDIESVEVLKDASATSIYGARASNGVILINTKKGKVGTLNVNFKANTSFQTISNPYDMVDAKDYMNLSNAFFKEQWLYDNKIAPYGNTDPGTVTSSPKIAFTDEQIAATSNVTDWFDEITRTGILNEEGISIDGGTEKARFQFSLNHFGQKGVVVNSGVEKYMARLGLELDLNKWLTTGITASGSQTDQDNIVQASSNDREGLIRSAMLYPQYLTVYDKDGNYTINPDHAGVGNPVSYKDLENKNSTFRILVNNYWNMKLAKGLDFRVSWGVNSSFAKASTYYPTTTLEGDAVNGKASITQQRKNDYLLDATLTYSKKLFGNHQLKVMGGYAYQKFISEKLYGANSNFVSDVFGSNNLQGGGDLTKAVESGKSITKYLSYFGRINYDIADKYLFTFTLRADGSDKFGADNKFGYFPSGAFAWRVSEENFMKKQNIISNLKLRLSLGQTGNAEIGGNAYGFYATGSNYVFGNSLATGVSESQLPNSHLKWETTTEFNVGLDWGVLNNRLTGSIEYYQKTISDLLSARTVGTYYPVSTVADNLGKTQSRGFEVTLNSVNIRNKNLTWSTDLNFYGYKDKWKERNPFTTLSIYEKETAPLHIAYGYLSDGLIQAGETVSYMPGAPAGSIKVKDINGWLKDDNGNYILDENGKKQLSGKPDDAIDDADKVIVQRKAPDLSFGLGNSFTYKNFDLYFFFYGELGRQLNNQTRTTFLSVDRFRYSDNVTMDSFDRWSSTNQEGKYPSGLYTKYETNTDFYIEDADFIRLKNITLGYTVPNKWFKGIIKRARLYFDAQNLFVITNYSGSDPETDSFTAYPNQRTYSFGIELSF